MRIKKEKIDYGYPAKDRMRAAKAVQEKFYNQPRWRKFRLAFLSRPENAFCAVMDHLGRLETATVCDHVIRRKAGGLRLDYRNLMGMSDLAHNIKRGLEANGEWDDIQVGVDYETYLGGKYPTAAFRQRIIEKLATHIKERWRIEGDLRYL